MGGSLYYKLYDEARAEVYLAKYFSPKIALYRLKSVSRQAVVEASGL